MMHSEEKLLSKSNRKRGEKEYKARQNWLQICQQLTPKTDLINLGEKFLD